MKRLYGWWKQGWPWLSLVWLFAYLGYVCMLRVDPDFGWHYRSGEYILAHGVPSHDVFTYTAQNFWWINHEWLNDVLMYGVAHQFGYWVLGLVFAAAWTTAFVLAAGRRLSWTAIGLLLGGVVQYVGVRGVTWTALGLAAVLAIMRRRRRRYPLLPPLFIVWSNVHAGFAIGLAMVALAAVLGRDRRLALWGAAAIPCTLLNPYGYGVYVELWRTMSDHKIAGYIVEWAPLAPNYAVMPLMLTVITLLLLRGPGWSFDWVRPAGLAVAALWSNRHMPLLAVGSLALVDQGLRQAAGWLRLRRWPAGLVAIELLAGVAYPLFLLWRPPAIERSTPLARPVKVLQALKHDPCRGRVFNDYSYGGLMIWALPGVPVYIDGRMPSWSGSEGRYLDRYVEVLKGGEVMRLEFARYNVQCVVLSKVDTNVRDALAAEPGWRLELRAQDAELWRRD